jgi:hypothetical protein
MSTASSTIRGSRVWLRSCSRYGPRPTQELAWVAGKDGSDVRATLHRSADLETLNRLDGLHGQLWILRDLRDQAAAHQSSEPATATDQPFASQPILLPSPRTLSEPALRQEQLLRTGRLARLR